MVSSIRVSLSSSSGWCIGWSPWWDAVANIFTMVRACSNARVRLADRFEFESSSCWIKVVELSGCSEFLIGLSWDPVTRWSISDDVEAPDPSPRPWPLSWSPFLKGRASEALFGCLVKKVYHLIGRLSTYAVCVLRRGRRSLTRCRVQETPIEVQLSHFAFLSHLICKAKRMRSWYFLRSPEFELSKYLSCMTKITLLELENKTYAKWCWFFRAYRLKFSSGKWRPMLKFQWSCHIRTQL